MELQKDNERERICFGCASHINEIGEEIYCNVPTKLFDSVCPCSICMVKSMCKKECEDYNNYMKTVLDHWKKEGHEIDTGQGIFERRKQNAL